jgi:ubiquinone/menaquinone biosynthesis C-methylase UbiE
MKHGDFTALAADYAKFRPGYAPQVAAAILNYAACDPARKYAADVGAGTGIWTRVLAAHGFCSVVAVEPNDEMRAQGEDCSRATGIEWRKGSAEATGLAAGSVDLVSMASSLHWADFDKACEEFHRILRPAGVFAALWNTRMTELNPLLAGIEAEITRLKPGIRRKSSGRSALTDRLTELLSNKVGFSDVLYMEGRELVSQTPAEYLGLWRSVNDLQVQMGPELFGRFLEIADERVAGLEKVETTYLTRAWVARRV